MSRPIFGGPRSLGELLARSAERFGDRPALLRLGPRREGTVTYRELAEGAARAARGLAAFGVRPGDRIGLVSENGYEWLLADLGCALLGAPDVPRGGESPPKEIRFVLRHSAARAAFFDRAERLREVVENPRDLPDLRTVVLFEKGDVPALPGVEVMSLEDLLREGASAKETAPPRPEDLLTVVYTSGTTADPKGVMLSHANVLSNVRAVPHLLEVGPTDVCLSLLPTWHMFERTVEYAVLSSGASILYTDPKGARSDLLSGRPTLFAAVPKVWEMLSCAVEEKFLSLPAPLRGMLRATLRACDRARRGETNGLAGLPTRWLARIGRRWVLPRLQRATVGRLRAGVSGGATLSPSAERLLHLLQLPIVNGYGLTETSPIVSCAPPGHHRPGSVGCPIPGTEVRIVDADGRDVAPGAIGLVWVRGPQVTRGYWLNTEATRRAIDGAGWFDTGDLGTLDEDGYLSIRGRAKDTIVLSGGENVEPEGIEGALRCSPYIDQVAVLGQDRRSLALLVVPRMERLREAIPEVDLGDAETIEHPSALRLVRSEVDRLLSREEGFRPFERPTRIALLRNPFRTLDGTLTATMKLRRTVVEQRYASVLEDLFGGETLPPLPSLFRNVSGGESEAGPPPVRGLRRPDHGVDEPLSPLDGVG